MGQPCLVNCCCCCVCTAGISQHRIIHTDRCWCFSLSFRYKNLGQKKCAIAGHVKRLGQCLPGKRQSVQWHQVCSTSRQSSCILPHSLTGSNVRPHTDHFEGRNIQRQELHIFYRFLLVQGVSGNHVATTQVICDLCSCRVMDWVVPDDAMHVLCFVLHFHVFRLQFWCVRPAALRKHLLGLEILRWRRGHTLSIQSAEVKFRIYWLLWTQFACFHRHAASCVGRSMCWHSLACCQCLHGNICTFLNTCFS